MKMNRNIITLENSAILSFKNLHAACTLPFKSLEKIFCNVSKKKTLMVMSMHLLIFYFNVF